MLSQEAEVGVKCKWKRGCALIQRFCGRCLVSGVVVNDQMQVEISRGLLVNQLEKVQKFANCESFVSNGTLECPD
jgi:hypothetical protein